MVLRRTRDAISFGISRFDSGSGRLLSVASIMLTEEDDKILYGASLCDFQILFDENPIIKAVNTKSWERLDELGKGLETVLQGGKPPEMRDDLFFNQVVICLLSKHSPKYFGMDSRIPCKLWLLHLDPLNFASHLMRPI